MDGKTNRVDYLILSAQSTIGYMGVEEYQNIEHALETKEPNKLPDKIHNLYIASQKCINWITA